MQMTQNRDSSLILQNIERKSKMILIVEKSELNVTIMFKRQIQDFSLRKQILRTQETRVDNDSCEKDLAKIN